MLAEGLTVFLIMSVVLGVAFSNIFIGGAVSASLVILGSLGYMMLIRYMNSPKKQYLPREPRVKPADYNDLLSKYEAVEQRRDFLDSVLTDIGNKKLIPFIDVNNSIEWYLEFKPIEDKVVFYVRRTGEILLEEQLATVHLEALFERCYLISQNVRLANTMRLNSENRYRRGGNGNNK